MTQPAVTFQIKQLEERLGHALFERRGRQLYLTEAGRIALDHADTIFSAGEELVETLKLAEALRCVNHIVGRLQPTDQVDISSELSGTIRKASKDRG